MTFNINTQDSPVDPQKPIDAEQKQKKKRFHSLFQRSSRVPEIVMLSNTIPARTAAFATNEILHMILSNVPINHYASIRRVSKTWNKVVTKIGYHVNPDRVHTSDVRTGVTYSYPEYAAADPIIFNPIFTLLKRSRNQTRSYPSEHYNVCFSVDCAFQSPTFRQLAQQFLTSPPITQVALTVLPVEHGSGSDRHVSTLRVRDGIRFRDLAEALRQLNLDAGTVRLREKCKGHLVRVHFVCTSDGPLKTPRLAWRMRLGKHKWDRLLGYQ